MKKIIVSLLAISVFVPQAKAFDAPFARWAGAATLALTKNPTYSSFVERNFKPIVALTCGVTACAAFSLLPYLDRQIDAACTPFAPPQHVIDFINANEWRAEDHHTRTTLLGCIDITTLSRVHRVRSNPRNLIITSYYIKPFSFDRLVNARRMQNVLTKNQITDVVVPDKWVHRLSNGKRVIVCQGLNKSEPPGQINTSMARSLLTIQKETGYGDWIPGNILSVTDSTNKDLIGIIDTEDRSFQYSLIVSHLDIFLPPNTRSQFEPGARSLVNTDTNRVQKDRRFCSKTPLKPDEPGYDETAEQDYARVNRLLRIQTLTKRTAWTCLGIASLAAYMTWNQKLPTAIAKPSPSDYSQLPIASRYYNLMTGK